MVVKEAKNKITVKNTVCVVGLGYVGAVQSACLTKDEFRVIGVDLNQKTVDLFNEGVATIIEPNLDKMLSDAKSNGMISATTDIYAALDKSNFVFVAVGTPTNIDDGSLDLSAIFGVCRQIANSLKTRKDFLTIAIRSTVKPGTCRQLISEIETISNKQHGVDFILVSNPEFLREGTAINDYYNPAYILIGSETSQGLSSILELYSAWENCIQVDLEVAEIIKYINNSWHATKVAFANEIGSICQSLGISDFQVMDVFKKDTLLNISDKYMTPGFAYGGACLPKDLSALVQLSTEQNISTPLLESVSKSNELHIERALNKIKQKFPNKKLGFIGISFKEGTDDLRQSPALKLIKALQLENYEIMIWDSDISKALKQNSLSDSANETLGDLKGNLVESQYDLFDCADAFVLCKNERTLDKDWLVESRSRVLDLQRQTSLSYSE